MPANLPRDSRPADPCWVGPSATGGHSWIAPASFSRQEVRPAFYALLADEETVEIVDVVIDEDWLETLGDDFA